MEKRERGAIVKSIIYLVLISIGLTIFSLACSTAVFNDAIFRSYFRQPVLLFMNFIPILVLNLILWLLTSSVSVSYLLSGALIIIGGIANKSKLTYRDDPVIFSDLTLIKEAGKMTKSYDIPFNKYIALSLLIFVIGFLVIRRLTKYKKMDFKYRLVGLAILVLVTGFGTTKFYYRQDIYDAQGDMELINRWIETERHQAKGFVYPFIYSSKDILYDRLEGYDQMKAKKDLESYSYQDIEDGKKVHVISIMLEAYNDFSKFDGVDIDESVYKKFHKIQEDAVHGELVTNIFAGNTIVTERAFLTGYENQPKYYKDTNSIVWYLKEQGYFTEAMHPITGSFYNRRNINKYLGFDNFDYLENKYEPYVKELYLKDKEFFEFIIEGYEKSLAKDQPYFNFSVTYQNHGPYDDKPLYEDSLLDKKPEYKEEDYNIINNYLHGIKSTGDALEDLIGYFEKQDEPVVVVLFGDHNPWLGQGNSVYNMLGINLDLGTEEGFRNYYETPYVIWGNDKAREVTANNMKGYKGPISSNYLSAQLFEELNYKGNEYMQALREIKEKIPVTNDVFYKEGDVFTKKLSEDILEEYKDFKNLEFYYSRHYKRED